MSLGSFLPPGALPFNPEPQPLNPQAIVVSVEHDDGEVTPGQPTIDPVTGALHIEDDQGGVTINFSPEDDAAGGAEGHDDNLAEALPPTELSRISAELMEGIESDASSMSEWLEDRAESLKLLALKREKPKAAADAEGMSSVRSTLLLEAALRFQANARGELLPAGGPVKVTTAGQESAETAALASALQDDLNHYLTVTDRSYVPDTDRMLWMVGVGGCGFKKVYHHPIKRRPVSESIDAADLIVSNASAGMADSGRVTQRVKMRPSVMRRMQLVGAYRTVSLGHAGSIQQTVVEQQADAIQGVRKNTSPPEQDQEHDLYECYCELDILGFEHQDKYGPTGLPLPYKVTIDRESREVLEIRRNWDEDDPLQAPRRVFVKYPFVPALGYYDIGLGAILGNQTVTLTAGIRELLDSGMFANFPGFLVSDAGGRQNTTTFRVPPGGGAQVKTGALSIRDAVMPLPYNAQGMGPLMQLLGVIETSAQKVGGTAELQVGEGKQDAPVGTTLALIEQATKVMDAVHKRIHAAQAEEFQLLLERLREDPEALWRGNRKSKILAMLDPQSAMEADQREAQARQTVLEALSVMSLVPQADPNVSSQTSRIMKAVALKQLQKASPELYNGREVDTRILRMIGWDDPDSLFAPPAPPQQDPKAMAQGLSAQAANTTAQAKLIDAHSNAQDIQFDAANRAEENRQRQADRDAKLKIAALDTQRAAIEHGSVSADQHHATMADLAAHTTPSGDARMSAAAKLNAGLFGAPMVQGAPTRVI